MSRHKCASTHRVPCWYRAVLVPCTDGRDAFCARGVRAAAPAGHCVMSSLQRISGWLPSYSLPPSPFPRVPHPHSPAFTSPTHLYAAASRH